ncbi:hypothetical protein [Acinetobacter ursingii]|uniref:hypothetical protein n=1 Tax=Acinetobacter ursingii TaxID=108980 RepID=UPI00124F5CEF|nr:hypothetical protein [Acinetobacter ursingii]
MNERTEIPPGATHYFSNDFRTSYYFYSNDVNLWFVWVEHWNYWSSKIFVERILDLKPVEYLSEVRNG